MCDSVDTGLSSEKFEWLDFAVMQLYHSHCLKCMNILIRFSFHMCPFKSIDKNISIDGLIIEE